MRDKLIEAAAETDDELTMKYLEGDPLTDEELRRGLRVGVATGKIVPVLCGSSLTNKAIPPLMDAIVKLLPSPVDRGAVKAAMDAKGKPEGNIGAILKKIIPSVEAVKKANNGKGDALDLAVRENVMNSYKEVMKSKIVSHLVHEGKLKVVAAEYHLGSGKVETLAAGSPSGEKHAHH